MTDYKDGELFRLSKYTIELEDLVNKQAKNHGIERNLLTKFQSLKKENDELKAYCKRLHSALIDAFEWDWISASEMMEDKGADYFEIDYMQEIYDVSKEIPEHSLNEIKAQAIEEMIINMKKLLDDEGRLLDYEILDYAYILRTNGMRD